MCQHKRVQIVHDTFQKRNYKIFVVHKIINFLKQIRRNLKSNIHEIF